MAIISRFPMGGGRAGPTEKEILNGAVIDFAATAGENTLHLRSQTGGNDCTIWWGDGKSTEAPVNGGDVIHTYANAGTYTIVITGQSFAGFYVNNQPGKEKYLAIHSMGRWAKDTAVDFSNSFYGCTSLTTLPDNMFRYCTAVKSFGKCFYGCHGLTELPAELFKYNMAATDFTFCFYGCNKLTLRSDIFGTVYGSRFFGKTVSFTWCFYRASFSGIKGTAPALWKFTFGKAIGTCCYSGAGNNATSISNYSEIPTEWL